MLTYLSHKRMLHLSRKLHNFCKAQEFIIYSKNINDVIVKVIFKNWSYFPLSRFNYNQCFILAMLNLTSNWYIKQSSPFSAYKHFDYFFLRELCCCSTVTQSNTRSGFYLFFKELWCCTGASEWWQITQAYARSTVLIYFSGNFVVVVQWPVTQSHARSTVFIYFSGNFGVVVQEPVNGGRSLRPMPGRQL